jgi:ubiquinone biosynthesis protein
MDEGLGATLDPDFNLIVFAKPYLKQSWLKSHSVEAIGKRLRDGAIDLADFAADFPAKVMRLTGMAERGELTVTSRLELQDPLIKGFHQAANRIAMSVLTVGLIIGLSVLALVYRPTGSEGLVYQLLRGFLVLIVATGLGLMISLWRSTR